MPDPLPLPRALAPRYWPLWTGLGVLRASTLLPIPAQLALGRGLGRAFHRLAPKRRRIARINVELAFPDWDTAQHERLVRAHFEAVGMAVAETALCWWASAERLRRRITVEGLDHLRQAHAQGRGVILLGAHFTAMELALRLLHIALDFGPRITPVYQIHADPVMEAVITGHRERHAGASLPHDDPRAILRALKRGDIVWYAPDQAYSGPGSALIPFFGVPAASHTATSRLARISRAPVVPFFMHRTPDHRWHLTLHPPLADFPSDDPAADTRRYHALIEEAVRAAPEQYLWLHRRFKGRGPELPDVYAQQ